MGNLNKAPWWVLLNKSMLDTDLADLYGYEVKRLNEQENVFYYVACSYVVWAFLNFVV